MIAAAKPGLPINDHHHTAYDYVKDVPLLSERPSGTLHQQYGTGGDSRGAYINASETRPLRQE